MKILGITLLILGCLMGLSIGIDLLMGFELKTSLYHAVSPLIVMETAELTIFLSLIILAVGKTVKWEIIKRKQI